ncbi:adenylate kinase, chloroplastic [Cocos nucifera]|uniref:adenylate kinase n=1 Tax=Cocos nucifera TaxID=13894 RepID=A0A8K0HXL5_COCNU|nr:adenylate kinase, chloroplastic [Cocos nucifera]
MGSLGLAVTSMAAAKPTPSLASSPSLGLSNEKSFASLHSSDFLETSTSRASFRLEISHHRRLPAELRWKPSAATLSGPVVAVAKPEPVKIMISGAPASGKGTQCELIKKKYGLVHISAGDLLRAEIAAGTENGKRAKEYMEKGMLVPDEIVVMMVNGRLLQPDAQENGWLLDGYPRSLSQAAALEDLGIRPDLFILLDVSEEVLIERVVGRRLDPVTGKIYHLKYSPPENEEIAARLTQRFDDTEEKIKLRLKTHRQNVEAVLSIYKDVIFKVNGDAPIEDVFAEIDKALSSVLEKKLRTDSSSMAAGMTS